jgi:hypothetical protein
MISSDVSASLLLGNRLAPITSTIAFVSCDVEVAAQALGTVASNYPRATVRAAEVPGTLAEVLGKLLPLRTPIESKYLVMPTKSTWTALFSNNVSGMDTNSWPHATIARAVGCQTAVFSLYPSSAEALVGGSSQPASQFILGGPSPAGPTGFQKRAVYLVSTDGKWEFGQFGDPLSGEPVDAYRRSRLRDRLGVSELNQVAGILGISPFDHSFYDVTSREARLIEVFREWPVGSRDVSIEEAQRLL